MRRLFLLFFISGVTLNACVQSTPPPSTPTPTATPAPVVAAVPPDLEPAGLALQTCAQALGVSLAILTTPQSANWPAAANIRLWWGPPPANTSAYALTTERLVPIVARENQANPSEEALRRTVIGQITSWKDLGGTSSAAIALWLPLLDSAAGQRLLAWLGEAPLRGDASLAPDPRAMLQSVGSDQAALGFVPSAWLTTAPEAKDVRAIEMTAPAWEAPVLALLSSQAPRSAQAVIGCMQQGPGQDALRQIYTSP